MPSKPAPEFQPPTAEGCVFDNTTPCHPKPCLTETMQALGTHLGELPANEHYPHQARENAILLMRIMMQCATGKMPALKQQVRSAQEEAKRPAPFGRR